MDKKEFLIKDIVFSTGAGESSRVYLSLNTKTGETEMVIEKTITERYHPKHYDSVMDLYEKLNAGNGRRLIKLSDLT